MGLARKPILASGATSAGVAIALQEAVNSLGDIAVQLGADSALVDSVENLMVKVVTCLAAYGIIRYSTPRVTPVDDPRDNDGNILVSIPPPPK